MATTVSKLITEAFLDMGAIAAGGSPNTDEQDDAFLRLNQLISSWSNEELTVYQQLMSTFNLQAGVDAYTVGTTGTFSTAARPQRITAWRSKSGHVVRGGAPMSMEAFGAMSAQEQARLLEINAQAVLSGQIAAMPASIVSPCPSLVGADANYPNLNLRVFPPPSSAPGTIEVDYWTPLPKFAAVGDTVNLPDGFEDALHFNLAVALYPQYSRPGGPDPMLIENARRSKSVIIAINSAARGANQQQQAPPQAA
jgi:hypothetical protein